MRILIILLTSILLSCSKDQPEYTYERSDVYINGDKVFNNSIYPCYECESIATIEGNTITLSIECPSSSDSLRTACEYKLDIEAYTAVVDHGTYIEERYLTSFPYPVRMGRVITIPNVPYLIDLYTDQFWLTGGNQDTTQFIFYELKQ